MDEREKDKEKRERLEKRNALVEANLGLAGKLVRRLARRFRSPRWRDEEEDLRQEAVLGLLATADAVLDGKGKGLAFSTLAWRQMQRKVTLFGLPSAGVIRVPRHAFASVMAETREAARKASGYRNGMGTGDGAVPYRPGAVTTAGPAWLAAVLKEEAAAVREEVARLPGRWARVIQKSFLEGMEREEVMRQEAMTRKRLWAVTHQALARLREALAGRGVGCSAGG